MKKSKGLSEREKRIVSRAFALGMIFQGLDTNMTRKEVFEECAKAAKKGGKG